MSQREWGQGLGSTMRAALFVVVAAVCAACSSSEAAKGPARHAADDPSHTLTILAGSELKDVEPYIDLIHRRSGVWVDLTYSGTLAGIDRLHAGDAFDAAWFSHAKYLVLSDPGRVKAQEKIALSPVVLGVKRGKAQAFGWIDHPSVTWADIASKVKSGQLRYAMTN